MEAIPHHAMDEDGEIEVPQLLHKGSRRTSTSSDSNSSGVEDGAPDVHVNANGISTKTNIGGGADVEPEWSRTPNTVNEIIKAPISGQESTNRGENVTEDVVPKREDLVLGEDDEEVIELEFEKAHTHTAHCPKCNSQITRVVLRRKISRAPRAQPPTAPPNPELFGCLSCFSFFIPSGKGLNCFGIFGGNEVPQPVLGEPDQPGEVVLDSSSSTGKNPIKTPGELNNSGTHYGPTTGGTPSHDDQFTKPEHKPTSPPLSTRPNDVAIVIEGGTAGPHLQGPAGGEIISQIGTQQHVPDIVAQGFESVEILKCIVYGGLLESITSLGVVSSAASSGATKLNIIALCLANLVSGLFLIGQNLMDLKSESEQHGRDRYYESLGRRGHFLLHATFAIVSFLVFGLVPPAMFAFTELWEVGVASFACIFILAIAKAYVQRCDKFSGYIKIILYYVTMAVMVSGIAYVVGDQVKDLMEKYGWFETSPTARPSFVPDMNFATQAWSSY